MPKCGILQKLVFGTRGRSVAVIVVSGYGVAKLIVLQVTLKTPDPTRPDFQEQSCERATPLAVLQFCFPSTLRSTGRHDTAAGTAQA